MDFKKALRAFLAKVTKKPLGDIDAILEASDATEDGVVSQFLDLHATHIAELTKPKPGQTFQDGYAKGKKEVLTTLETSLKEKYEIESDLTGAELVEHIVTEKGKTAAGTKPKEITEDDVRKHPAFVNAEKAHKAALKQAQTEAETKLTEVETGYKKKETRNSVAKNALAALAALNPVLPGIAAAAENQQRAYLDTILNGLDFEVQGDKTVVMKDGKVQTDPQGHNLTLEDLVKNTAPTFFEFKANNGGANPGGAGAAGAGGTGSAAAGAGGAAGGKAGAVYPVNIVKPTNFTEYAKIVNDTNIPVADRRIVADTWKTELAAGTVKE